MAAIQQEPTEAVRFARVPQRNQLSTCATSLMAWKELYTIGRDIDEGSRQGG